MFSIILSFLITHFSDLLLIFLVGMFTKALVKQFGNDRAKKINDTILSAMLWAEEIFGIGHGQEKWTKAWQKIIELLNAQGIKLKDNETSYVRDLMKSNVPLINEITYSALPEKFREVRLIVRSPETTAAINKLKQKYSEGKE